MSNIHCVSSSCLLIKDEGGTQVRVRVVLTHHGWAMQFDTVHTLLSSITSHSAVSLSWLFASWDIDSRISNWIKATFVSSLRSLSRIMIFIVSWPIKVDVTSPPKMGNILVSKHIFRWREATSIICKFFYFYKPQVLIEPESCDLALNFIPE